VLTKVPISPLATDRFAEILDEQEFERFGEAVKRSQELLAGRRVWNVNSTARGGGVAEMLVSLLAYARGAGVDAEWIVIAGNAPFFTLTKRIHNQLHGSPGDGGELGEAERQIYESTTKGNAEELVKLVRPEDVVIVHDPQPAGLVGPLKEVGATVIWRCHVGVDVPNDLSRAAWEFLIPYVGPADAYVFSREAFGWEGLSRERMHIIAPSIDAFSPKNQALSPEATQAILAATGLLSDGAAGADAFFTREDGTPGRVDIPSTVYEEAALTPESRYVLQVSRWDRLKDPLGVIQGFADHVVPDNDAHLVYAGPAVEAVSDDPEGLEVLNEARALWEGLPDEARARVHLAALPMEDAEENAAIVNALQRRAHVVVQKSLAEGFGLTVAEAMWKARPVVASRIGGIQDQIVDGQSGVLLEDAADLSAYGAAVNRLLDDPEEAESLGREAQARVRGQFLGVRSLMQYLELMAGLLE